MRTITYGGYELLGPLLDQGGPFCLIDPHARRMWRYTPALGLHTADIDDLGNVVLTEHRLRHIMSTAENIPAAIDDALGTAWDDLA